MREDERLNTEILIFNKGKKKMTDLLITNIKLENRLL